MTRETTSYTNRQGNVVTIYRGADGSITSIKVEGTGSLRAFAAQTKAARAKAMA